MIENIKENFFLSKHVFKRVQKRNSLVKNRHKIEIKCEAFKYSESLIKLFYG